MTVHRAKKCSSFFLWVLWSLVSVFTVIPFVRAQTQDAREGHLATEIVQELQDRYNQVDQLRNQGKEAEAFARALELRSFAEARLPANHLALVPALNTLALLHYSRGDYTQAEVLFRRCLSIQEQHPDQNHPSLAQSFNNLAALYYATKDYSRALPLFNQARQIYENTLGEDDPIIATLLNNIAALYYELNQFDRAEELYQRALVIRKKNLSAPHPDLAQSLNNLGVLYDKQGNYHRAEPLLKEALTMHEQIFAPEHPVLATSLHNLALLYWAQGHTDQALTHLTRAIDIHEHNLSHIFTAGSAGTEEQKHAYMQLISGDLDAAVSLHAQAAPHDRQALQLALSTVLRRKGRVLDMMVDTVGTLRNHLTPHDKKTFDQLTTARAQLASAVLNKPKEIAKAAESHQALQTLIQQIYELEGRLSARSLVFRSQTQPVTLERIQETLPAETTLVEFVAYRPFLPHAKPSEKRWGPLRYLAYIIYKTGPPHWVPLGESTPIHRAIGKFRRALRNVGRQDHKALGRELYTALMQPIRPYLKETQLTLISPDGLLHLLPFDVLIDEEDRYLIESLALTYLTAGRDLVRLEEASESRDGAVIIGDPAFNERTDPHSSSPAQERQVEPTSLPFPPLPGTAAEAHALAQIFPHARLFTGTRATEAALKALHGPRLLHIATHGFFSPIQKEIPLFPGGEIDLDRPPSRSTLGSNGVMNPLLYSGLAFAGANPRHNGPEDGILTALEASSLDLWGTQLVVLSACDTGLGEIENREGVYGLRRAIAMAGAESQVMSLWKVSDAATQQLMTQYYQQLRSGAGRSEGLRQAKLTLLRSQNLRHPFYWASFILSGAWTPLQLKD